MIEPIIFYVRTQPFLRYSYYNMSNTSTVKQILTNEQLPTTVVICMFRDEDTDGIYTLTSVYNLVYYLFNTVKLYGQIKFQFNSIQDDLHRCFLPTPLFAI